MATRALLIQPRDIRWFWGWSPPPLGLLYLAAAAPETVVVDCAQTDRDERDVIDEIQPDVVGMTMFTSTRHAVLDVLKYAKSRGAITVVGGPHVRVREMARQVADNFPFVDYIIRGDGETAWQNIVNGTMPSERWSVPSIIRNLDSLAIPRWDAVDIMSYPPRDTGTYRNAAGVPVNLATTPRVSVVFSRGCVGRCRFCNAWRDPMRRHSADYVRRMVQPLADMGVRHLCLDDDCWATDEQNAIDISRVLGDAGFVWCAETRAELLTPALADIMASNGCWQISVGLEHGSQRMLDGPVGKNQKLADVLAARRIAWDAGMRFFALVLTGYPGETDADRTAHDAFMRTLQPDDSGSLGRTLLLPGTDIYNDAVSNGHISHDVWLSRARHVLARTDGSAEVWIGGETTNETEDAP